VVDVPLSQLYRLCDAYRAEAEYLKLLSAHGRFPGACCVAGSHALHRMMLFDLGMRPDFLPSDLDVFVSDPGAFAAVIDLSKLFLDAVHRLAAGSSTIERPGENRYEVVAPMPALGDSFPLEDMFAAIDFYRSGAGGLGWSWCAANGLVVPAAWMPAFRRLPAICGLPKAHQMRTQYRVLQSHGDAQLGNHFSSFVLPLQVNIVLVSFDHPTPAERVVDGFDMEQCRVVMKTSKDHGGFVFTCSDMARMCAARKQIRLTPFAFGPLKCPYTSTHSPGIRAPRSVFAFQRVLKETIRRIRKYENHGFQLVEDSDEGVAEVEVGHVRMWR